MKKLIDAVQELTGVDLKQLQDNDNVILDVPGKRIIIQRKKLGSQSFDITESSMNNLLNEAGTKKPDRNIAIIGIVVTLLSTVVTIVATWFSGNKKCTKSKTTETYEETTTYSDGRVTTRKYTETTETTDCEEVEDSNPTPTPTPNPNDPVPECCSLCGEQLIPGQRHYCK